MTGLTRVTEDAGFMPVSEALTNSSGGGWGIRDSISLFGSPSDVATKVSVGTFWPGLAGLGFLVLNTGG